LHGAWFGTLALAAALGVCALAGVVVARCIASDRARRARLACHAISFLGTVCVALPALASSPIPRALADVTHVDEHALARAIDVPVAIPIALALFGTALMVAAARALLRAGGTADPTDPPTELVDHGIYAHLRHPMIVSEIALVAAASIAYGTVGALVYAVMFATVLLGPWRRAEERALTHRYRGRYRAYANTVAALVPRIPKRDRDRDRDRNSFATRS
jgi:protein-S-isoprenylcysteine O-methyltransferase Ste14